MPKRFSHALVLLFVLVLVAPACDDGGDGAAATSSTSTTAATATSTTTASGACSAASDSPTVEPQEDLPAPVSETRSQIAALAAACDVAGLAALAEAGDEQFTASFGGIDDVAEYWQRLEQGGEEPLRILRAVVAMPNATDTTGEGEIYVWPAAATYGSWDEVPAEQREALRAVYDDDDFEDFDRFGAYIGYRVGVAADGEWRYFVAGD